MRKHPVIAEFRAPKQRMTREYRIIIIHNPASDKFSVFRAYMDGDLEAGSYDLTADQAWEEFQKRVATAFTYGPGTWDPMDEQPVLAYTNR